MNIIRSYKAMDIEEAVQNRFPRTCQRLRRFRPYDPAHLDAILDNLSPGHQHTLHAFPGLRVGDFQVGPRFLRISLGPVGIEVFRESDGGLRSMRVLEKGMLIRYYYDLVMAGYKAAEIELELAEKYPPAEVDRGSRRP